MLVRHSLSLTLSNMQLVFKVLLYALLIVVIGSALVVTIASPILDAIGETINVEEYVDHFVDNILKGDGAVFESIITAVDHFADTHPGELIKVGVLALIVAFVVKLMFALIVCPVGYILNNKMATNFTEGFFHSVMVIGWKGVLMALVYTLISFPIDVLIVVGAFFLGKWMVQGIGLFGMIFAVAVGLVLLTLRMSAMGQLVPTLVNENLKFTLQFKRGFKQGLKIMHKIFPAMLTLNILAFGIITTTLIPTFMIIPIVAVPMILVGYTCIHLIAYYQANDKSYYIDELVIENKKEA